MLSAEVAAPPALAEPAIRPARRWSLRTIRLVLAESRPAVQVVFLLRSVAASGLGRQPTLSRFTLVSGWTLLIVAIYVFNGVTDITGDSLNNSQRPIATRQLASGTALRWCAGLAGVGMAMCGLVGRVELGLAAAMLLLGWAYSAGPALKNHPAGFAAVIGVGAGLTYAAGSEVAGAASWARLACCSTMAAWVGLCCAAKDFSDVDGDRLAGRRTWPVIMGPRGAAVLLTVLALTGSAGGLVTARTAHTTPLPALVLCAGSVALCLTALASGTAASRAARRRPYRVFMCTQYATNLVWMFASAA
jgi:4-hydroxybenzoate polyprenyltransferase